MSGERLCFHSDNSGTYCLLAAATLLDILTPELLHNVDKFIAGCQTYEGGFACASWAFGGDDTDHRAAMAEAHGGYTSCSLASHFLLTSVVPKGVKLSSLDPSFPKPIDIESAIRWSAFMQGEAGEAGGLRGRTNKLVDGCYGWWVGGGFPVLEALRKGEQGEKASRIVPVDDDGNDEWTDEASMLHLFNRGTCTASTVLTASRSSRVRATRRTEPRWRTARQARQAAGPISHLQQPVGSVCRAAPHDSFAVKGGEEPRSV